MNGTLSPQAKAAAPVLQETGLQYAREKDLTIHRRREGKGFSFTDLTGKPIQAKETLERIRHLAIPPAWEQVAINRRASGHIQATGLDAKGRKQYLYHAEWVRIQQETKFNKMTFFGEVLPTIREQVAHDMYLKGLQRNRVLATVVWILENVFIRVGNKEYTRENHSYGLTTLREKHVAVDEDVVRFQFKGKRGIYRAVSVEHPRVAQTIRHTIELPGYEIFQYVDDENKRHVIDSRDVNEYLKQLTGEQITAKDFRTWGGTITAGKRLYEKGGFTSKREAKKNVSTSVKEVAHQLGNTPAVSRKYYIHPAVIQTYEEKILVPHFDAALPQARDNSPLQPEEYAAWTLIKDYPLEEIG